MMNNRFMKEKQIPVEIEGRTYYGCCAMCKDKLTNDPSARIGTDPVSGRQVDKAKAVIGAKPNNAVVYFESSDNFDAYVREGGQAPAGGSPATPAITEIIAGSSSPSVPVSPKAPPGPPKAGKGPGAAPALPTAAAPASPSASPPPTVPPASHQGHEGH